MGERGPRDLLLRGQGAQGGLVKLVHPLIVADAERIAADALWSSPFLFFERCSPRAIASSECGPGIRSATGSGSCASRETTVVAGAGARGTQSSFDPKPTSISGRRYVEGGRAVVMRLPRVFGRRRGESPLRESRKSAECCGQGHGDCAVDGGANLGDRSGFLITHEVRPIDSARPDTRPLWRAKSKKTSTC